MSDRDSRDAGRQDRPGRTGRYPQPPQQQGDPPDATGAGAPPAAAYHPSSRYGGQAHVSQQQPGPSSWQQGRPASGAWQQQQPQHGQQQQQYGQHMQHGQQQQRQQPQHGQQQQWQQPYAQQQYGQRPQLHQQQQYGQQQPRHGQQQFQQQFQQHQGHGFSTGAGAGGSHHPSGGRDSAASYVGGIGSSSSYQGAGRGGTRQAGSSGGGYAGRGGAGGSRGPASTSSHGRGGADRSAPYQLGGRGPPASTVSEQQGQQMMLQLLTNRPHNYQQAAPGQLARVPPGKPQHCDLGLQVKLLANLFKATIDPSKSLFVYDVVFIRGGRAGAAAAAGGRGGDAGSSAAAGAADDDLSRKPKAPDNAREILQELNRQHWEPNGGLDWCFDGSRNLVTPAPNNLLPEAEGAVKAYQVAGMEVPGRAGWTVCFRLTKPALSMGIMALLGRLLANSLREANAEELNETLRMWLERRQPLEWVLRQGMLGQSLGRQQAGQAMMEVKRALYFNESPGNMNIGGGLRAISGLLTGARLAEDGVLYHVDLTASAFLRTDLSIAEWMAEVLGYSSGGGGQGGRGGGRGGFGGGRGRGRAEPAQAVIAGDRRLADWLRQELRFDGQSFRSNSSWRKLNRAIRGKKVVYTATNRQQQTFQQTFVATGLTDKPATHATFQLQRKQPPGTVEQPQVLEMSVADYQANVQRSPLMLPFLPLVDVKPPKKMEQMWLPAERTRFADKQRIAAVTHSGGTELMIEAARKEPLALASGITEAVKAITAAPEQPRGGAGGAGSNGGGSSGAGSSGSSSRGVEGQRLLNRFGLTLDPSMMTVDGRVLPGPWLSYKEGSDRSIATNTGSSGSWNMNRLRFTDGATLRSWGVLAALPGNPNSQEGAALRDWLRSLVMRFLDLGMDLGLGDRGGNVNGLVENLMSNMAWVGEDAGWPELEAALRRAKDRHWQLLLCFIWQKPSPQYAMIKAICELGSAAGRGEELGIVTQVVVASKTDLLSQQRKGNRSQYQANLAMKINTKCGGTNSRWAASGGALLQRYFGVAQVPSIMVFGVDVTHPGLAAGGRSKAAMVGTIDAAYTKYAHTCWVEADAGGEMLTAERFKDAVKHLLLKHFQARNGQPPGVLLMYRDGVSDGEMLDVRRQELTAVIEACAEMGAGDGSYRPRITYVVVQKRHHVRLLKPDQLRGVQNLDPGTVVDRQITSPHLFEFYLNSHKAIIGTSKVPRYVCLLDELGFGAEGLQLFSYWLTYLYCRCTRSVSVVAPVYYAHLLAFRAKVLEEEMLGSEVDSASVASGGSGPTQQQAGSSCGGAAGSSGGSRAGGPDGPWGPPRSGIRLAQGLDDRMFFV